MPPRHLKAVLILGALASAGCPGRLQNPARFTTDGSTMVACTLAIDVPADIFQMKCGNALCHDPVDPSEKLDLSSPGVASRLVGVPSGQMGCAAKMLVNPTLPADGYMIDKVTQVKPCSGLRMPYGLPRLSPAEVDCIRAWIQEAVMAGGSDGGGGGDADQDTAEDAPAEAATEAAASACQVKYGSVSNMICTENATSCEFLGKTMNAMSCRQLCAGKGGTCTDAFANATGSCTKTGTGMECDVTMAADQICICTL